MGRILWEDSIQQDIARTIIPHRMPSMPPNERRIRRPAKAYIYRSDNTPIRECLEESPCSKQDTLTPSCLQSLSRLD